MLLRISKRHSLYLKKPRQDCSR